MSITKPDNAEIAVVGLGYVGLPVALALSRRYSVTGFDAQAERISELRRGYDRTREVDVAELAGARLRLAEDAAEIAGCDIYVVAVPTPVDDGKRPDLDLLLAACRSVGEGLKRGALVVFESTVYPGVTERVCGPALESASGLACGCDFFLGYSPERVNPGDKEHAVSRITKVIAGQTLEATAILAEMYGTLTTGGVYVARDIMTAEAAKVIENAQRDINIAFVNEVTEILRGLDLSTHDVLDAAATKWNFLDFRPGLVGGHCIGVDPYYLAEVARSLGHEPEIVLAGRRINDRMGARVADWIAAELAELFPGGQGVDILVLGLTFKEDIPDLRNSKIVDVISGLEARGHRVRTHDPLADPTEARELYGVELLADLDSARDYQCLIGAVAHAEYRTFAPETFTRLVQPGGLVADIKGMWRQASLAEGLHRWQL